MPSSVGPTPSSTLEAVLVRGRRAPLPPVRDAQQAAQVTVPTTRARARPGWMLEEVTTAGREDLDAGHVRRYDGEEDADATGEVELLRRWGPGPDSVLVDVGAGTGQLALAAAPHCARVVAVDVSPVMLDVLTEKVVAGGLSNVEVAHAGFLTYEHTGPPADVVCSRYALHQLPDAWKAVALHRLRQAMRTGGLLRLWDVVDDTAPGGAEAVLEAWCATGADGGLETEGARTCAEHEEHVRDEHSTSTWLLEPMLARAGFTVEEHQHSADGVFARYLARAA